MAKWGALAVVLALVGRTFAGLLRQVEWSALRPSVPHVALAVAAAAAVFVVMAAGYRALLAITFGKVIPWPTMLAAAWVPQLGKYVPGKLAAVAAAVGLLRRAGVPAAVGLSCYVILDGATVTSGLMLAGPLLAAPQLQARVPGAGWLAAGVVLAGLVVLSPPVFNRAVGLGLRLTGRPPLAERLGPLDYAAPLGSALVQWALCGVSLWAMTAAIHPMPASALPACVSTAALAITVSYLALFAPGGVGVREACYLAGLAAYGVPEETAAVVALLMRLQSVAVEAALALAGLGLMRWRTPAKLGTAPPVAPAGPDTP